MSWFVNKVDCGRVELRGGLSFMGTIWLQRWNTTHCSQGDNKLFTGFIRSGTEKEFLYQRLVTQNLFQNSCNISDVSNICRKGPVILFKVIRNGQKVTLWTLGAVMA